MVSFRVSPEEYTHLRNACSAQGVRSVSELARTAMQNLILAGGAAIPLDLQVQELRDRVTLLAQQIDYLSHRFDPHPAAAVNGE